MISVIIPTYNREATIERSIKSVLEQTYDDFELIIVDDCSSDNTEEIVKQLQKEDKRLRYYKLNKNSGACVARNYGIEKAKGEYIAFQDSDDAWKPDKLKIQLLAMLENNADISFTKLTRIKSSGKVIIPEMKGGYIDRDILLKESIVSTQTIMGKRECFVKYKFDSQMPRMQDYEICIRLSEEYKFFLVDEALVDMYVQEDSISVNWKKLQIALDLISKKHFSLIESNKDMKFFIMHYLALAKEKTDMKSLSERLCCFQLNPSIHTFLRVIKAFLYNFRITRSIIKFILNNN